MIGTRNALCKLAVAQLIYFESLGYGGQVTIHV